MQTSRSQAQSNVPSSQPGPVLELLAGPVVDDESATPEEELESAASVVELELDSTAVALTGVEVLPSPLLELELELLDH